MVRRWHEVLREFEGSENFLYPDSTGLPTCGVGHACETADEAVEIFGTPDARQDWQTIRQSLRSQSVHLYASLTTSRLSDDQINNLEVADIADTERKLTAVCPDSDSWPIGPRDATLDIEYNVRGGVLTFPKMLAAIRAGDWTEAAAQSSRPQLQVARNRWTSDSILSALTPGSGTNHLTET